MFNPETLEFDFDLSTTKELAEIGKFKEIPAGDYHAILIDAKTGSIAGNKTMDFKFQVVAGTVPDQAGQCSTLSVWLGKDGTQRQLEAVAYGLSLLGTNQLGKKGKLSFADAVGRQVVVFIRTEEYDSKKIKDSDGRPVREKRNKIKEVYPYTDPAVRHVPLCVASLSAAGLPVPPRAPGVVNVSGDPGDQGSGAEDPGGWGQEVA